MQQIFTIVFSFSALSQMKMTTKNTMLTLYRIQAALHYSRFRDKARKAAGDVMLENLNIRPVFLQISLVWVCLAAHMVTHL